MASILVVCTGNVCRSPVAEGLLRSALRRKLGDAAPSVASAGTAGWEGSPAEPGSVTAAARLGVDISAHRGRRVRIEHLREASLVLAMAAEHRERVASLVPEVADRTFTLKELVRILEAPPPPPGGVDDAGALAGRVAEASELRRAGFEGNPRDEDVVDPLGMGDVVFHAVAHDLEIWCGRLVDGLFGQARARAAEGG